MEYIQTILFQVSAAALEQASQGGGLIPELDEHRDFLKGQPGFRDLRITRSINPEGNILVVVETRWDDDASLVRYETNEPNVASIVRKHSSVIVPDSLQVLDMEALRTESSWAPAEHAKVAMERVTLPILIPVGVLAFIVLVIYGLSRVYLELGGDAAVALAVGISLGVLIFAFYFATNPKAAPWQMFGVLGVAAIVLLGASVWAVVEEDEAEGGEATNGEVVNGEATPTPGEGSPPPTDGIVAISMGDNFFDPNEITVAAGSEVEIDLTNNGAAIHNMRIAGEDGEYNTDDDVVSDPEVISGGQTGTVVWTAPSSAGEIIFHCDFHPTDMIGTITVE
jgi:plastocyanin/heme-degrading monooxygenase HmoA